MPAGDPADEESAKPIKALDAADIALLKSYVRACVVFIEPVFASDASYCIKSSCFAV